jgi:protocatechuate 3,4-dioxygenase beta subunit
MQSGIVVLCGLLLTQAAASTPTTGRIVGRIVADGTNAPIADARILVLPSAPPRPTTAGRGGPFGPGWRPMQAQTDENGRFVIEKVEPGTYRLEVQKTGFAPAGVEGRGATTEVAAGKTTEVALALHKGGVIAGKVLDAQGEPLADVRLMAMRRMERPAGMPGPPGASTFLVPAPFSGQQQTNDLGEYRIAGLAPGEYYVAATPNGGMSLGGPGTVPASTGKANVTTYYPGTIEQTAATPIKVAAGDTVYNIVFAMQSTPGYRVTGRVVDENGAPVSGAMVMLMGSRPSGFMGPPGHATSGDDGRFTFTDVASGSYHVNASIPIQVGPGRGSTAIASGGIVGGREVYTWTSLSGRGGATTMPQPQDVTVNGADVSGIRVVVQRPQQ